MFCPHDLFTAEQANKSNVNPEKIEREIHRLIGLLRFSPDENGVYIARCAPDYFVLPAFAEHFTDRFGETPWAIIDEKRSLCLSRQPPEQAEITKIAAGGINSKQDDNEWEELWKHYHKTINNESRKNTGLQRQLMPKRYWKYLPEV